LPAAGQRAEADLPERRGDPVAGPPTPVEAVAVGQGKIMGLGGEADVAGLRTSATRVIDLQGRTLLPGLIDPHHHTCPCRRSSPSCVDVGYTLYLHASRPDRRAEGARRENGPPGQWVLCNNFDNLLQRRRSRPWRNSTPFQRSTRFSVWYTNCHDGAANAKAFEAANIPQDIGPLPKGRPFRARSRR
jgi:predicted amidohydrolase YtcJ